jgi:molybdopterin/thiamine biosynthesis adenylyltransferase
LINTIDKFYYYMKYPEDKNKYDYLEATSRNIGILKEEDQKKIARQRVAIAGCGAEGGSLSIGLARLGIQNFSLSDPKTYDLVDMNRQCCEIDDIERNKSEVIKEKILKINPNAKIDIFPEGLNEENINKFLEDADLVIDALDYERQDLSILLHKRASEQNLYVFSGVSIGYGCNVFCFSPKGMNMEEFLNFSQFSWVPEIPQYIDKEIFSEVISGERPAPVIIIGVLAMSSLLLIEIIKFIIGREITTLPSYIHMDLMDFKIKKETIKEV